MLSEGEGVAFDPLAAAGGEGATTTRSMINLRPSQGNRSRGVEDAGARRRILDVVARLVVP